MLVALYASVVLLGVLFVWPKKQMAYNIIVIALCAFMVYTCTTHADYNAYMTRYYTVTWSDVSFREPILKILMIAFRGMGIQYDVFITIQMALLSLLIPLSANLIGISSPFVWSAVLLYPGVLGFVQIQQYFAACVTFFAFAVYVSDTKYNILKYVIICTIAGMIHVTAFFMMIVPICSILVNHRRIAVVVAMIILCSGFASDWMLDLSRHLFTSDVNQAYLAGYGGVAGDLSRLFTVCETVGMLLLLVVTNKWFGTKESESTYKTLFVVGAMFVAMIPILIVNTDFLRLGRYILLDNMAVYCAASPTSFGLYRCNERARCMVLRIVIGAFFFVLFYGLVLRQACESVVLPMFHLS